MYYRLYEMQHAALQPMRAFADATRLFHSNPYNPLSDTAYGRTISAYCELFERSTRRYSKPEFGLKETIIDGEVVAINEVTVWSKPFCNLIHFERELTHKGVRKGKGTDPIIVLVAPMSGHYATLLRGTVEALLPFAEVYITDWIDARTVPLSEGDFGLDDYIDYLIDIADVVGPLANMVAVCQPSVPVMAAAAVMAADKNPNRPASMTLMGGPIDTRVNPTAVNTMAEDKDISWFEQSVVMPVPWPHPGFMRKVYPGFLQLGGFMSMNLDRHMIAHKDFFMHLVDGDGDSAEKHREFYDEYNAVMDLDAKFYLDTVDAVFIKHDLPNGNLTHHNKKVKPQDITDIALFTVEGEKDDISGVGQTEAAHFICAGLDKKLRQHYVQPNVGHYGVFNGSRFRKEIAPRIIKFARDHTKRKQVEAKAETKAPAKKKAVAAK